MAFQIDRITPYEEAQISLFLDRNISDIMWKQIHHTHKGLGEFSYWHIPRISCQKNIIQYFINEDNRYFLSILWKSSQTYYSTKAFEITFPTTLGYNPQQNVNQRDVFNMITPHLSACDIQGKYRVKIISSDGQTYTKNHTDITEHFLIENRSLQPDQEKFA